MSHHSRKKCPDADTSKHGPMTQQPTSDEINAAEEKAFIEALIASGQAAKADAQGNLPPGATHEIIETEEGDVKVVRRRFSAY